MSRVLPVAAKKGMVTNAEKAKRTETEARLRGDKPISQEPPETLSEEAKAIYLEVLDNLPLEDMCQTDGYSVEIVADAIANIRACRRELVANGLFYDGVDRKGIPCREQSKAIDVYRKYTDILKRYIPELGLSPAARSRIASLAKAEKETKHNTLLDILRDMDEEENQDES